MVLALAYLSWYVPILWVDGNVDWHVEHGRLFVVFEELTSLVDDKNGVDHEKKAGNVDQESIAVDCRFNFPADDEANDHP